MNKIAKLIGLLTDKQASKIELAEAFIWYHHITHGTDISVPEVNDYFVQNALPKYNPTYLRENLRSSRNIMKGQISSTYRPVRKYLDDMATKFPFLALKSEDIITDDTVLPDSLTASTRGYIENISKQINASYHNNIFDGCAILMRRLVEILLIHSYEEAGNIGAITDVNGMKNLSYIINHCISNKPFKLSKEANEVLDDFRQLGNFSAHKIHYNAKRKDVENVRLKYRMTIEELLYTSKIKK